MQIHIRNMFYNTRKFGKVIKRVVMVGIVITLSVSISSSTYQEREKDQDQDNKGYTIISLNNADNIVRKDIYDAETYVEQLRQQEIARQKKEEEQKQQTKLKQNSKYIASRGGMFKYELVRGEKTEIKSILWDASDRNSVSPMLVYTVAMIETGGTLNPRTIGAETKYGTAKGLMQMIPPTQKELGVRNPFDPYESADAGARYLKSLYDMFKDMEVVDSKGRAIDPEILAGLGYNMGGYNLKKRLKDGILSISEIPSETRKYYEIMRTYYYD